MEIAVLVILLGTMPFLNIGRNSADPSIDDHLDGTKTARWNFQDPANYTSENVTLGGGTVELAQTGGSWLETDYSDFNQGWNDTNSTLTPDGNITLLGNESNLITNGNFSTPGDWNYVNSTDDNVTAQWSGSTGEFSHESAFVGEFDDMDLAVQDKRWWPVGTAPPIIEDETVIKSEGESSLKLTWNPGGDPDKVAGISRNDSGTWDWRGTNRLKFWAVASGGPVTLNISLTLYNLTTNWTSAVETVDMDSTWGDNDF
ncbi:MAG: hypothetical protein KAI64_03770, partial [Thermoplasmata archaeon]|nr:hypothetical protein [Thermoplasmata archaeon]